MAKGLSREQLQHAKYRLDTLQGAEYAAIVAACRITHPPAPTVLEVWQGIKKGKILLREMTDGSRPIRGSDTVATLFNVEIKSERERDQKKYDAMMAVHRTTWDAIYDRLILSDAPDALKLIQSLIP